MYDAIIVGARCAGSPVAMQLARKGHRVLLVDRASFPSDTISTHFIQIPGMARLARWGLLDKLMDTGCPAITGGLINMDGVELAADFEPIPGLPGNAAPRRIVLDKILVDGAVEAGAELRDGVMIDELLMENGRVVGVRGHSGEESFTEQARLVIGADGRNSMVARSVEAPYLDHTPALGGGLYSYWSGVDCDRAEIYFYEGAFSVAFPTHDGHVTVAIAGPPERYDEIRKAGEAGMLEFLDRMGTLGERVRAGSRAHDLVPVANLSNFIREAWGPGWALAGDAVYHKDPTPADGISDAFRSADLLSDALDAIFSGHSTEEDALTRYKEMLETYARPLLEKTLPMSGFSTPSADKGTAFLEIQALHAQELAEIHNGATYEFSTGG